MASMRFIMIDDQPQELAVSGNLLDIVASMTYLTNRIYTTLGSSDSAAADHFRSMMGRVMADPNSPVWTNATAEGETAIAVHLPSKNPNA